MQVRVVRVESYTLQIFSNPIVDHYWNKKNSKGMEVTLTALTHPPGC